MDATFDLPALLLRALRAGGDLLLPRLCLVCRARNWGAQPLCLDCLRNLARLRWMDWLPEEEDVLPGILELLNPTPEGPKTWSLFQMDGVARDLIHALKYSDYAQCAPFLIGQLRWAQEKLPQLRADWLIPVPLHAARLRDRGFNQSRRIAKRLGLVLGIPLAPDRTLIRRQYTVSQTHFDKYQRGRNLERAFACRCPELVQGKEILLVDDVCTTGSTLAACAEVLTAAGAKSVKAFTVTWMPKQAPEAGKRRKK